MAAETEASEVEPATSATARTDISMAGSTMAAMYISLLEPIPPNVDPASNAAKAVNIRTVASR